MLLNVLRNKRSSWHPVNIIDVDVSALDMFTLPKCITDISLGHLIADALPTEITTQFDFVTTISHYMLFTEVNAATQWHIDFTGSSVFYVPVSDDSEKYFFRQKY